MAEITYKTLKEGDRVKVEIEGVITNDGRLRTPNDTHMMPGLLAQAKITLLEPELKVGRAVTAAASSSGYKGRVVHIEDGFAWFRYDSGGQGFVPVKDLRNIPEEDV